MLITKLGYYSIILGQFWIKKCEIINHLINNTIAFWPDYYIYIRVFSTIILDQTTSYTEITLIKTTQDITFNKIIKKTHKKVLIIFSKYLIKYLS